jgi:mannan endo-1,4-beta-mannosidase
MLTFCPFPEGMGLATGSDGSYPFGYSEGNDFEATLAISTIDFGTIHLYPSQCKLQNSLPLIFMASSV